MTNVQTEQTAGQRTLRCGKHVNVSVNVSRGGLCVVCQACGQTAKLGRVWCYYYYVVLSCELASVSRQIIGQGKMMKGLCFGNAMTITISNSND